MLLLLSACTPADQSAGISDLVLSNSTWSPTAVEVSFTSELAGEGWVEVVSELGLLTTPRGDNAATHSATAVNLPPLGEVSVRGVVEIDGERFEGAAVTWQVGQLLPVAPEIEITVDNYDAPEGAVLLVSNYGSPGSVALVDFHAGVTWSVAPQDTGYCAGVVPSGGGLLCNHYSNAPNWQEGTLRTLAWSGEQTSALSLPDSHHFITTDSDGEVIWLRTDIREDAELGVVVGDEIVRGVGEAAEVVFSTWDHFSFHEDPSLFMFSEDYDWTHANWIEYHPGRDSYLLSTAYASMIMELNADFEPIRTFSGANSTDLGYSYSSGSELYHFPHGAHWSPEGELVVFSTQGNSRVLVYGVNDDLQQLEQRESIGASDGYTAEVLGEAQVLESGEMLISWGSVGIIQIRSPEGAVLWEAQTGLESFPTQVHYLTDPYQSR